jgi:hypothetical protein
MEKNAKTVYRPAESRVIVIREHSGTLLGNVTGVQGAHGTAPVEAQGVDARPHPLRYLLKKSSVRCQASLAATSS